jgi:hypothetical protein
MCEGLSGFMEAHRYNGLTKKENIYAIRDFHSSAKLRALNIADNVALTNPSLKAIATNLFPALEDLCLWGNYLVDNDGFLEICVAKNRRLKRVNRCGCYKISQDAGLWLQGSVFVLNYNRVDDFNTTSK